MKYRQPDASGHFGPYGGQFVPETVIPALDELVGEYARARADRRFRTQWREYLARYAGRPTPLYPALRLGARLGGAQVYLKREDLLHTGAHKINNALGQALLAVRMGKRRLIAETGAGQHGVATATVAALFGLSCEVYMGEEDIRRQSLNVFRMRLLGSRVVPVTTGTRTLKDATSEAIRDWATNVRNTHYIIGSVVGPHPYPMLVRDFQSVIGRETRRQIRAQAGRLPDAVIACVGGGSNAMGMFHPFLRDEQVHLFGVEAAGAGLRSGRHCATLVAGRPGVLHGSYSYLLQTRSGQVMETHSVSAGLDYPGTGPEHSLLRDLGRVHYAAVTDQQALKAFHQLARLEGIIPALESAHALAHLGTVVRRMGRKAVIVVCLSGRGDKDVNEVARLQEVAHDQ